MPMPRPNDSAWTLKYADPKSDRRILMSLPSEMLRDLRVLAKSRSVSISEQLRQLITAEVARVIQANPAHSKSFRGSSTR